MFFVVSAIVSSAQTRKVFPYEHKVDDLANGLRVVTVPTDYPNLVSLYIVVGTGSSNEVEENKSGYAHFFEHLMFSGSRLLFTLKIIDLNKCYRTRLNFTRYNFFNSKTFSD